MKSLQVYSRAGCHLCAVLIDELRALVGDQLRIDVRDIDTNPEWHERWFMDIPVVEHEGTVVCMHFLDPDAITGILRG
ncbi:MAG: glutaredoxin family protein [Gammaproteobacteria bacterium]|nr:glutaredoxin family protein [Gammaproteobacteria bacterium]MDH5618017.1 glutaredoxin family protein [Gammaproteobacteria bacterium]